MTIRSYYEESYDEDARLADGPLEWVRSKELIARVLPGRGRVADIAGGTGRYAAWLAGLGHQVNLLDLVPSHVARARDRAAAAGVVVDCVQGDARALPWADETFDVVLVMGALYHLQERSDRVACLREAHRVLKPGGALAAAYVSRWASLFDGYRHGLVADPRFVEILDRDLVSGHHENPTGPPTWFTTAYFHTPGEIGPELADAGFAETTVLAVEGFTSACGVPAELQTPEGMSTVLRHIRLTEAEPAVLGVSSHFMSLSRKAWPTPG